MKLRYILPVVLVFVVSYSIGQTPNCEALSRSTADEMATGLRSGDFEKIDQAIANIIKSCGVGEVPLRVQIITKIFRGLDATEDIKTYYDNEFYNRTIDRIRYSRSVDFGYRFQGVERYFEYVPFRHPVDSLSGDLAYDMVMNKIDLTKDERLICTLFSGDIETFQAEWKPRRVEESYASEHLKKTLRTDARRRMALALSTGIYSPTGSQGVFGNNPIIGFMLCSPIRYKLTVDIGVKFRINHNDDEFQYYAMNALHTVDSKESSFFGAIIGYKVFEKNNFVVRPQFGIGADVINTGLVSSSGQPTTPNNPNSDKTYYDVTTLHTSGGISMMKLVGARHYLGVELGYHITPYNLDKNLKTKIDSTALSAELFFRL